VIHLFSHRGKDHLVVETELEITEKNIVSKVNITVDVTNISEKDRLTVYRIVNKTFNKRFTIISKQQIPHKPWYKFW
jgi:glucose-6-phosphate-specific signal transduction histidine kinase